MSSYNSFQHPLKRDAILVTVANSLTSFFSGTVVFSILGFMAHEAKTSIDKVAQSGPGLAFIVYPEVVSKMSMSNLWSVLFFLMLITLALGMKETRSMLLVMMSDPALPIRVHFWSF